MFSPSRCCKAAHHISCVVNIPELVVVLQPLRWCWVDCVIHHERDVREEQHHTYMWREQAIIEWSWCVNSIVACCHGAKLCAYAARDFRSQQNGAVTRMWRLCGVQPSHKERAISVIRCKKEGCCCNLSGGVALIVWFTTNGMYAKNKNICMWREQAIIEWSRWSDLGQWPLTMHVNLVNNWLCLRTVTTRVISSGDLYCCLLPRCEALRTCCSGFPIARVVKEMLL